MSKSNVATPDLIGSSVWRRLPHVDKKRRGRLTSVRHGLDARRWNADSELGGGIRTHVETVVNSDDRRWRDRSGTAAKRMRSVIFNANAELDRGFKRWVILGVAFYVAVSVHVIGAIFSLL